MNTDDYTISWQAWFDNGTSEPSEYSSENSTLNELPDDGFLAMRLQYIDGTARFISGNDFYFFAEHATGITFGQTNELPAEILARYPGAVIKRGKYVAEGLMKRVNDMMTGVKPCSGC